jgi:DNA-binding MarR family transcriptional regulator
MRELVHNEQMLRTAAQGCSEVGITPAVMKVLLHLRGRPPAPMRDLAARFGCDASYVTALVDGLERRGLAERHTTPSDRRVKVVTVTAEGEAVADRLERLLSVPPSAFEELTEEEVASLHRILTKLVTAEDRALAGATPAAP